MLFCLTIHELVSSLSSELNVFYLDDGTIGGSLEDLRADVRKIEKQGKALGLHLNVAKSELISYSTSAGPTLISAFPGLQFVIPDQATLLGSPLGSEAMRSCLEEQLHQLKLIGDRLCHLQMHDAITILRHSFTIPKLLHILRHLSCFLITTAGVLGSSPNVHRLQDYKHRLQTR